MIEVATLLRGSEDAFCGCGVGESAAVLSESRRTSGRPCPINRGREGRRGCSPTKKETVVKAEPARPDLSAEVASGSVMGCDGPDEDSSTITGGLMSPAEAARLVSAEFFAEQQGAAVDDTSDVGTRSPVAADEIYSLPSPIDENRCKPLQGSLKPSTPETVSTNDESSALEVGKSAESYLEECFVTEVSVLNRDKFNTVPQISRGDFTITCHLGRGSFSDVFEVSTAGHRAWSRRNGLASSITTATLSRPAVAGKNQKKLAMKCLRPQIRSESEQFIAGAEDLVHETAMLASLDHPSIIKLHARASGSLHESFVLNDGYFILLDRLDGTLTDLIEEWKCVPERLLGPGNEELSVARSIADAVAYLHSKRIVFRDLKPDNVGFDSSGTLKLFDFGFAEGLPEKSKDNPTGLLSGRSGTPRYM